MPVSDLIRIGFTKYALLVLALLTAFACNIREDLDDCADGETVPPPPVEETVNQFLYLRIADVITGEDITATEQLEDDIMVYLFDRTQVLVDTIPYTMSMIRTGVPVDLTGMDLEGGYASVWANLTVPMEMDQPEYGERMTEITVDLAQNESRTGFYNCPGDMFFGFTPIDFKRVEDTVEADTVFLMRKNARLHVTVRGLEDTTDADIYYFRMGVGYSGYDYGGTPRAVTKEIWETGTFSDDDLISLEPFWMISYPDDLVYDETNSVNVSLYRTEPALADTLLATATRDVNGDFIKLVKGMTTNVLIVFDQPTGGIMVQIAITPWDEIYQWTIW